MNIPGKFLFHKNEEKKAKKEKDGKRDKAAYNVEPFNVERGLLRT